MNRYPPKDVSEHQISIMGAISQCTIFRLKLQEIKSQLPSNILNIYYIPQITAQGFNEAFNSLSNIMNILNNNTSNNLLLSAFYILQGEQYLHIVNNYLKQIQSTSFA